MPDAFKSIYQYVRITCWIVLNTLCTLLMNFRTKVNRYFLIIELPYWSCIVIGYLHCHKKKNIFRGIFFLFLALELPSNITIGIFYCHYSLILFKYNRHYKVKNIVCWYHVINHIHLLNLPLPWVVTNFTNNLNCDNAYIKFRVIYLCSLFI